MGVRPGLMAPRRGSQDGFALLEILLAFLILALGLSALSTGIVTAMRSDARTQINRTAWRVAQSCLESAGVSEALAPGYSEGLIANKFRWRQTIRVVDRAGGVRLQDGIQPAPTESGLKSFWVEIAVEAPDGTATKLGALKLAMQAKQ